MKLRRNERCPIHKSLFCCGRETVPNRPRLIRLGVQRIEDPHHPRGYRELRSRAERRKLLNRKIVEQDTKCEYAVCKERAYSLAKFRAIDHPDTIGASGTNTAAEATNQWLTNFCAPQLAVVAP